MRAGRLCDFCLTEEADPDYREVIGFERVRNQGGANQIAARRPTGRRVCRPCLSKLKGGDMNGAAPLELPGLHSVAS